MTLLAVLCVLAITARVTRFVTDDVLFAPVRQRVIDRFGPLSEPATLVGCPWCVSVWISGATTLAAYLTLDGDSPPLAWVALWLGASYVYSLIATNLDA